MRDRIHTHLGVCGARRRFWCTRCGFRTVQEQRGQVERVRNPAWPRKGEPEFLYAPGLPWRCARCHVVVHRSAYDASLGEPV